MNRFIKADAGLGLSTLISSGYLSLILWTNIATFLIGFLGVVTFPRNAFVDAFQ